MAWALIATLGLGIWVGSAQGAFTRRSMMLHAEFSRSDMCVHATEFCDIGVPTVVTSSAEEGYGGSLAVDGSVYS